MEPKELKQELDGIKTNLETSVEKVKADLELAIKKATEQVEKGTPEKVKEVIAGEIKAINEGLEEIRKWKQERGPIESANQEAIDNMLAELKGIRKNTSPSGDKTFGQAWAEAMSNKDNIEAIKEVRKGHTHTIKLDGVKSMSLDTKAVGNMTLGANLSGDSVVTYANRQAILPGQKINFRDLMRTVYSDTGTYVHYKETAGEGSIGQQTEGSAKSQRDFDLTEVKTVNKYYSGFTRFSKQLAKSLPFFQGTLPSLLMREFFIYENSQFKSTVAAAATGAWSTGETDDVKKIIDYIAAQRDANYDVSYGLISHTQKGVLDKLTYTTGYYASSGGVVSGVGGTTMVSGVPLYPVAWMNSDKILLVDDAYLERIEVESLRVEFFEQDGDNVTKNLITARIECYEEVNPMLGAAFIYANL